MRLLKPYSKILSPGPLQSPERDAVIDWTHPLSNGLISTILPGAFRDLAADTALSIGTLPSTIALSPVGLALDEVTSNANIAGPAPPTTSRLLTWTKATVFVAGYCVANIGAGAGYGIGGLYGPSSASFINFAFTFLNASTARIALNTGGGCGRY